jgi:hypothetical protein
MDETPYEKEDILQKLLADFPELLPGDQINPVDPCRWLLVTREMPVPAVAGGPRWWALDHLLLDQGGTPTFVECKRAADSRSRREVVAQMLDYAANGIEHWRVDLIRQLAAENADKRGKSLDDEILEVVKPEGDYDIEAYWRKVDENLRAGRVRLIFVAEETSAELRRLVEFLNEKLQDVEVLAVEVKQFLGGARRVVVPRVIGLTEAAIVTKRRSATWDSFLSNCSSPAGPVFDFLINRVKQEGHIVYWGETGFSARARVPGKNNVYFSFAYGFPPNKLQFYFSADMPVSQEEAEGLRGRLMATGLVQESGQRTLTALISEENASEARSLIDQMLMEVKGLIDEAQLASS